MSEMIHIKETIEGVIKAINAVIEVDVTVIDKYYNRIAATGNYVDQIGKKVAKNSVFYQAMNTGQEFIVENPRQDIVCKDCERRSICEEYAEVCCPIFLDDHVAGIIGLVAFDEYQKNQVLEKKENLLIFLKRMSELITAKLLENRNRELVEAQSKQIGVLFNYIDSAIISVSSLGTVLKCNCKAKKLLGLEEGMNINDLQIKGLGQKQAVNDVFVIEKERMERYFYQTKPIIVDNKLDQTMITFSKEEELISQMNEMVNLRQVITFDEIIGESHSIQQVIQAAKRSSLSDSTVLIQGASGTGKEMFARAIHNESNRRNQPFVAINCAAIPESLIESELFGYSEGAFTGAMKGGKPGKFEIANNGTIFLDEIGDMPIHLQSKLLRVLQEREVERIGSKYSTPIDVRVIAATHQDLSTLIEKKMFREDLYYRLNVIPLYLSKLNERKNDIYPLADFFLKRYSEKLKKDIHGFSEDVLMVFRSHDWPGNIREMENLVEYAVNMATTDLITMADLPHHIQDRKRDDLLTVNNLEMLEKGEIEKALRFYKRDKAGVQQMIQALGISRATLYRKIKYYDL